MPPVFANPCIPPDLWNDILSYLPAKSLMRFRSVSKHWKSIIDNPEFSSLHSSRCASTHKDSHGIIVLETNSLLGQTRARCFNRCTVTGSYRQTCEIQSVVEPEDLCGVDSLGTPGIVGEVDGLLLVQKYPDRWNLGDVYLLNPSLSQRLLIPPPPSEYPMVLCLGFDPSTNDYTVANVEDDSIAGNDVEIFSLNSGSWSCGSGIFCLCGGAGKKRVSVPGSVHWIGCKVVYVESDEDDEDDDENENERKEIWKEFVSFDLEIWKASASYLPYHTFKEIVEEVPVVVDGSLVGLLKCNGGGEVEIWVLENRRDGDWSQRFTLHTGMEDDLIDQVFYLNKDALVVVESNSICAYDLYTRKKSVVSYSCPWKSIYIGAYVESLLLRN